MRDVNCLTDQEVNIIIRTIRRRAAAHGERIIKGKDTTNSMGFMIVNANTNTVTAGDGFSIDLESLAKMYNVVF